MKANVFIEYSPKKYEISYIFKATFPILVANSKSRQLRLLLLPTKNTQYYKIGVEGTQQLKTPIETFVLFFLL